jgi:hypothetical protein
MAHALWPDLEVLENDPFFSKNNYFLSFFKIFRPKTAQNSQKQLKNTYFMMHIRKIGTQNSQKRAKPDPKTPKKHYFTYL